MFSSLSTNIFSRFILQAQPKLLHVHLILLYAHSKKLEAFDWLCIIMWTLPPNTIDCGRLRKVAAYLPLVIPLIDQLVGSRNNTPYRSLQEKFNFAFFLAILLPILNDHYTKKLKLKFKKKKKKNIQFSIFYQHSKGK